MLQLVGSGRSGPPTAEDHSRRRFTRFVFEPRFSDGATCTPCRSRPGSHSGRCGPCAACRAPIPGRRAVTTPGHRGALARSGTETGVQRPHRISRLSTDDVGIHGDRVTDPGPWLFPSQHLDRPALPETITHRLERIGIQSSTHRAAALLHMAAELPPALLSDLLGLGRTAVQQWSTLAGRPCAGHIADRLHDKRDTAKTRLLDHGRAGWSAATGRPAGRLGWPGGTARRCGSATGWPTAVQARPVERDRARIGRTNGRGPGPGENLTRDVDRCPGGAMRRRRISPGVGVSGISS
jgi:hypothetical protein